MYLFYNCTCILHVFSLELLWFKLLLIFIILSSNSLISQTKMIEMRRRKFSNIGSALHQNHSRSSSSFRRRTPGIIYLYAIVCNSDISFVRWFSDLSFLATQAIVRVLDMEILLSGLSMVKIRRARRRASSNRSKKKRERKKKMGKNDPASL